MISKLDFVGIPSQDAERSRSFYVETLGLRPDEKSRFEVWVGETCFGIWEPEKFGMPFAAQKNAHCGRHPRHRRLPHGFLHRPGRQRPDAA